MQFASSIYQAVFPFLKFFLNFDENIVIMMSIITQITIPDQVKDEIDDYFK